MGQISNAQVAATLGLSHSTVSRMRTGDRVASIETLDRIVREYGANPGRLLGAAAKAIAGDPDSWVEYLRELFADSTDDLEPAEVGG